MEQKRIYLSSPTIHGLEQEYVKEAFDTNWVAPLGPNVNNFEKEIAEYVGIPYAAALSSGTAAIHLALKLAGVKPGEKVFVPSLTFSATCNPIIYENATPVFIDSEKETWNMNPEALRKAFEKYPDVRIVMVVHLYGTPAKIDEIMQICEEHGALLIEDAAESLGSMYNGKYTGTLGKYGIYSFNGNKIITTSGGGMLVSAEESAVCRARFLATQAREPERHYEHKTIGYNYRMSNVIAGIGRGQIQYLDEHIALKRKIYEKYKEGLQEIKAIKLNPVLDGCKANHWLTCITLEEGCGVSPLDIMLALEAENIESRPVWKPMHLQPVFKGYDFISVREDGGSNAEEIFVHGVCLPSDIKNTDEDMDKIIGIIKKLFQ